MDLVHTETNRGKKCIIYDGFSYRSSNILKNRDKVYRCSSLKGCSASITTDPEGTAVVKTKNTHSHDRDEHKAETRQLRVRVRQNSGDISQRPSQVIRGELQKMDEKRTTNGAESFHAHLNEQFYASHPNIFVFVDVLLKLPTTSYIKMRTLTVKAPVRKYEKEKMDFLLEQNSKLANGQYTTVDFVRRVGYKYSARTDL